MSNLKTKRVQIGDHSTATNNFVMHQSDTPDGKVHISNGTLDSHTSKVTLAHDGKLGVGTTNPDAILTVDSNVGAVSTGTLARFHSSKGENDSTFLQIAATRHPTASVQRVQLQALDDDGSTGRTLALNSSGGNVGVGTNSPNATLTVSQSGNNIFSVERTGVSTGSGQFGINIEGNSQTTVSYDDGAPLVFGTSSNPSTHVGFTERMKIYSSGYVTMDYQPSANAYVIAGTPGSYNNNSSNGVIIANGTRHNIGGHYNTSNGRFTCPISGRYFVSFSANWYNNNAGSWIRPQIRRNGAAHTLHYENTANNPTWMNISGSIIIDCSTGDYLDIYNNTQSGAGGGMDTSQYSNINFHKIS